MAEADKAGDGVRAVGRALDILLAFSPDSRELGAAELAQRVGLSRPTLYRLLYTLESKGFVTSFGEPQRFTLGPAVARLGQAWTQTQDIARAADPIMKQLWIDTRETVALWMRQGDMRFCIAEMPSPQALNLKRGIGSGERIARGASGRAILAFSDGVAPRIRHYAELAQWTVDQFIQELERTRERGYGLSRDELIVGAVAVAAPVFDATGVIGSMGIFGPAVRLGEREVDSIGKRVAADAARLSALLGGRAPRPTKAA